MFFVSKPSVRAIVLRSAFSCELVRLATEVVIDMETAALTVSATVGDKDG